MLFRNALLAVGAILVCAGIGLSLFWLSQMGGGPANEARPVPQPQQQPAEVRREAVLEAAHPLPAGTLIRPADFQWREIEPGEVRPGTILRKDASETEYLGAITRRDFAGGEPLTAADLVKTTDRRFLSAVLKPGTRAVTIAVDAPQGSSGMVLPGDRVDVVLTQNSWRCGWRSLSQNRCRNGLKKCAGDRGRSAAEPASEGGPGGSRAGERDSSKRAAHAKNGNARTERGAGGEAVRRGSARRPAIAGPLAGRCRGTLVRRERFSAHLGIRCVARPQTVFAPPSPGGPGKLDRSGGPQAPAGVLRRPDAGNST